jgi:heme/copper-type cytochrome/quinol oxidase subunit 3
MSDVTERVGMVPQREKDKLGVWLFLGGEVVLFSSLILTIIVFRVSYSDAYGSFRDHLSIPLVGLNTFVLIVSSYLVVRALQAIRRGNQQGLRRNLLGVMLLGALFLSGQAIEWASLFKAGVSVNSVFGTPFFVVTGIHGSHVLIGIAWASFILIQSLDGAFSERHYLGVEVFGLYWHFVDIVWIVLFSLIYLL